ncbi:MAG TPA: hypothetical protein VK510_16490 [Solirubrobacteraceae bacterium]|nr:hypothetical protein [Solirubrobacteraceae bacterium]
MRALLQLGFFYDPSPDFGTDPRPFVAMMLVGFVIGVVGHVTRTKALVVLGIGLIFLATFLLPLAANVLKSGS